MAFIFPIILGYIGNGIIIPTDELHHFSEGWRKTTNQISIGNHHVFVGELVTLGTQELLFGVVNGDVTSAQQ